MRTFPVIKMILNNQNVEFRDSAILDCGVLQETHPISLELPVSTAEVTIYTEDSRFSIYSDGEFYNSLSKNLPVELYESIEGIEYLIGKFYLDKWSAPTENTLKLELIDPVGICANTDYPGSFWELDTSVSTVLADVMENAMVSYRLDSAVSSRTVKGWIPPGKVRDALHQVCFAARLRAVTDKEIGIHITDAALPQLADASGYEVISNTDKTDKQNVTLLPLVTKIELQSHDYYNLGNVPQATDEIYNAYLEPGNYIIAYPKPYWKVWAAGVGSVPLYISTEDGRVITTEDSGDTWATARIAAESETFMYHSNYISIQVLTAGTITVWGYPWFTNDRSHGYTIATNLTPNVIAIEDATLVGSDNAADVLDKVVEYYALRYLKEVKLFPDPTIGLGDLMVIDSIHNKQMAGVTEKLVSDLTGGYLIDATFVGMERTV